MDRDNGNWRKASYSNGSGDCVETASDHGVVLVRDSTQNGAASRIILNMPSSAWRRFTDGIKNRT
jgi:hypothetical protein